MEDIGNYRINFAAMEDTDYNRITFVVMFKFKVL